MMRRIALLLCALCAGTSLLAAPAAAAKLAKKTGALDIAVTDIKLRFMDTPLVKFDNMSNSGKSGGTRQKWVGMEIFYVPLAKAPQARGGWIDDVTMEGKLVLATPNNAGGPSYIVLTGKTRFFTIEADDKTHMALLLVPPKLLDRYYPAGRNYNNSMFAGAQVSFYGPGKVLLGEGYWRGGLLTKAPEIETARRMMGEFGKNYQDVLNLRGGLYSKEKTPWALFNYDYYDLIYDEAGPDGGMDIRK